MYYIPSNVIYYITLDSWYISASTKLKVSLNPEDLKLIPRYGLWISDLATAWSLRRRSQKSGRIVFGRAPQTEVGKASIVGWFPQRTKAPFRLWGVPSHVWLPEGVCYWEAKNHHVDHMKHMRCLLIGRYYVYIYIAICIYIHYRYIYIYL